MIFKGEKEELLLENNNVINNINKNVGKKFAVLLCADESKYVKEKYEGYYGVFVKMLSEEGENWDVFSVVENEYPNENEVDLYDGFVITGSCSDAHASDFWICKLVSFLQELVIKKKKVLGICFGHQILARSLGGKTGRSNSSWDIGLRTIQFSSSSNKVFSNLKIPSTLNIIKCHQDVVLEVPAKVEVIGWSNKTSIEMFRYCDHIMGIQGHPEYNLDILLHLVDRLLQKHLIEVKYADELRAKFMNSSEPDKEAWRKLCVDFLKGRLW